MTTSELMKAMADAGAPFEAILIAVQALDAKDAEIAAKELGAAEKRAKDAARKRDARSGGSDRKRRPRTFRGLSKECPPDPPIDNIHTPPVSSNDETKPVRSKSIPAAKPDDVSDEVWRDWLDHRKRKGGTFTKTALAGMRAESEKAGWPLEAALSKAMQRNWQGFEAGWVKSESPKGASPPGSMLSLILAE